MERPDDAAYADSYFINANSATAPGIVDADRQPILDRSEVYSGVYGRASINFYAFNSNGNKGIACGLNNLQKIADGEPLGGKSALRMILQIQQMRTISSHKKGQVKIYDNVALLQHHIPGFGHQSFIFDRRREKREQEKEQRDLEYHEERMKNLK